MTYYRAEFIADHRVYSRFNLSNVDIELQTVYIKKSQNKGCILLNVYRPPKGNLQAFVDQLLDISQQINLDRYSDIYVTGDMNIDHRPSARSPLTTSFIHNMKSLGFTQIIEKSTRVSSTTATLIDVMYVKSLKELSSFVIPCAISDHYLVGCTRNLNYSPHKNIEFIGLSYRLYTFEKAKAYYNRQR